MDSLKAMARDTALLNIRLYTSLIDLQRNYLSSLEAIVRGGTAETPKPASQTSPKNQAQGTVVTPPIVLSAPAGKAAEETFEVVNHLKQPVAADVVVSGDLPLDKIRTEPGGRMLEPGETGVFRVICNIDKELEPGRDRHGVLSVPGLASRSIPLIVRRLPDQKAAGAEIDKRDASDPGKAPAGKAAKAKSSKR